MKRIGSTLHSVVLASVMAACSGCFAMRVVYVSPLRHLPFPSKIVLGFIKLGCAYAELDKPLEEPSAGSTQESERPTDVDPKNGSADISDVVVTKGEVPNAGRVAAGMRAGFRNCYQHGLQDSGEQGDLRLSLEIGSNGTVTNVDYTVSGNLKPGMVECVTARAKAGEFQLVGDSAEVSIRATFKYERSKPTAMAR